MKLITKEIDAALNPMAGMFSDCTLQLEDEDEDTDK